MQRRRPTFNVCSRAVGVLSRRVKSTKRDEINVRR